jgi:chorismate-pyruvate lyase
MDPVGRQRRAPESWLRELIGLFPDGSFRLQDFRIVPADSVPEPQHGLLVHRHHMTVTLESRYGRPVSLHVEEVLRQGESYARRLFLTAGAAGPVALAGIMRIWLHHLRPAVRQAVVEARTPLGRILIENTVLRRIETVAFLEVQMDGALRRRFGDCGGGESVTYGRLANIFCDGEPAVELLEIVAPGRDVPSSGGGGTEVSTGATSADEDE